MSDSIFLLRLEHENYARLLNLVDEELAASKDGDPVDYVLLRSMAKYFLTYPDQCHHPKEDLIYLKLQHRDPESAAGLIQLLGEHDKLAELTQRFAAVVREGSERPSATTRKLQDTAQEFLEYYRRHMLMEEEQFFPIAEDRLSGNDLAEIDFDLFDRDDPLFDHATEQQYGASRHRIDGLAEEPDKRQMATEEATRLRGLVGVERFNETMKDVGWGARLRRLKTGGYTLERDGQQLLYIPECSPRRAAWSAYVFLKGQG